MKEEMHAALIRAVKITAIVLSLIATVSLIILAPKMYPIEKGNLEDFWHECFGIGDPGPKGCSTSEFSQDDRRIVYGYQGFHGVYLYAVPTQAVLRQWPEKQQELRRIYASDLNNSIWQGYCQWTNDTYHEPDDIAGLIDCINELHYEKPHKVQYKYLYEFHIYFFAVRMTKIRWYWATFTFELLYLNGLIWFAAAPIVKRQLPRRIAMHWMALPILLALPFYLGFATISVTSYGRGGGIWYPWLLQFVRGGYVCSFDVWLLAYLPQILEPLSQDTGAALALSGRGFPGPTVTLLTGPVAILGPYLSFKCLLFVKNKPRSLYIIVPILGLLGLTTYLLYTFISYNLMMAN